jgi:DNA-binding SARP family transcriptional activator/tetratricopeptide (TPR) repeat protein
VHGARGYLVADKAGPPPEPARAPPRYVVEGAVVGGGLRITVLGEVGASLDGACLELGGYRQRAVLAFLIAARGDIVTTDRLVDALWPQTPPPSSLAALHAYISRLRSRFEPRRAARSRSGFIAREGPGYRLRVPADDVDAWRFEQDLRSAAALTDPAETARILHEALAQWRGPAFAAYAAEPWARPEAIRLTELRELAREQLLAARLDCGEDAELVPEIEALVAHDPLREERWRLLALALYRSCRQADALAALRRARQTLAEELGVDPGQSLRTLQERILAADPALDRPPDGHRGPARRAVAAVPWQVPADVAAFAGRTAELGELDRMVFLEAPDGRSSTAVLISAVAGTAGVGKTALAIRWAHRTRDAFPDGQLYVDLRGYDPGQPVRPADAAAGFLRALGMDGQDIPVDADERVAAYRTILHGRRMLIVLDNAATVEQVRPLLPGNRSCVVLVTSRDSLAGLVARHGARRVDLDPLPSSEAVALLEALIGGRARADPAATATLAGQCARLPLALRVAAELAVAHPGMSLRCLVRELADEEQRLDLFDSCGDPRTAIRGVLSWSCRHLPAKTARAFWLLGLNPGADFDRYTAAALASVSAAEGQRFLDALARANLIQPGRQGHPDRPSRYSMHDLLRAYAAGLASQAHPATRRAAVTRLFDYYLGTASAALDVLFPAERHYRPRVCPPRTPSPPLTDAAAARDWLDAHRDTLVAVTAYAATSGWPGHAIRLAATVFRYLETGCHYAEAETMHTHACDAARRTGDRAAEATSHTNLGAVNWGQGRYEQAAIHHQRALTLSREADDRKGEGIAAGNLGVTHWRLGRYEQAADHLKLSLALCAGDRTSQALALSNLGFVCQRRGRYTEAIGYHQRALDLSRAIDDRYTEAHALSNLGALYSGQARYTLAGRHLRLALARFREAGDRKGEAEVLTEFGLLDLRRGRYQQAAEYHELALELSREIGHLPTEAAALNGTGEVLLATGLPGQAVSQHATARAVATRIGDRHEQARAHTGLARAHQASGDLGQARGHWRHALAHYTELGLPDADDARAQLEALSSCPA